MLPGFIEHSLCRHTFYCFHNHKVPNISSMLPVGIEPTSHPPQGYILSIERRERSVERFDINAKLAVRRVYLAATATRFVSRDFMRAALFFVIVPCFAALSR